MPPGPTAAAPPHRPAPRRPRAARALLLGYGGVLTTGVEEAFDAFCADERLPPLAVRECLRSDALVADAAARATIGRLPRREFERALAGRLRAVAATDVAPEDLLRRMTCNVRLEEPMFVAVARLRAAGVVTVLVSNAVGRSEYPWERIRAVTDHVVLSSEVGLRKPDPAIFLHAAAVAGAEPEECVVVDDGARNVRTARALGMQAVPHETAERTIARLDALFEPV